MFFTALRYEKTILNLFVISFYNNDIDNLIIYSSGTVSVGKYSKKCTDLVKSKKKIKYKLTDELGFSSNIPCNNDLNLLFLLKPYDSIFFEFDLKIHCILRTMV